MQLYPARATFHVAAAAIGLVTLGAASRRAAVVAFGGAMLLAIALARALARLGIARLREAGFVMGWSSPRRVHRARRGATLVLRAELQNRSSLALRAAAIRPMASSFLSVTVRPELVDLAPGSTVGLDFIVTAERVGHWGIHGLRLVAAVAPFGAEAIYEVPLQFAVPLGIEVLAAKLDGGPARPPAPRTPRPPRTESIGRARGNGDSLCELREYRSGDPFKRIAWNPSARRGRLLVREMDRAEPSVLWIVVDVSVELWAGPPGRAPLDQVVDEIAALAAVRLHHGDRVGLAVVASRVHAWIEPGVGPSQAAAIASALARSAAALDADRSSLDEAQVARRVSEHLAPLDPAASDDWRRQDFEALAARAERARSQAPFSLDLPLAPSRRERLLRQYLGAFGIESPPRIEGERVKAELTLHGSLERIAAARPRPSAVRVWAPPPSRPDLLGKRVAPLLAARVQVRWSLPPFDGSLGPGGLAERAGTETSEAVDDAVRTRARAASERGERALRRLGIRVEPRAPRRQTSAVAGAEGPGERRLRHGTSG